VLPSWPGLTCKRDCSYLNVIFFPGKIKVNKIKKEGDLGGRQGGGEGMVMGAKLWIKYGQTQMLG